MPASEDGPAQPRTFRVRPANLANTAELSGATFAETAAAALAPAFLRDAPGPAPCRMPEIVVLGTGRHAADPAQDCMLRELGNVRYVQHPLELGLLRHAGLDLVIVETSTGAAYDVPHLVSVLRSDPRIGIVVRVHGHAERLAATRAGADLCVSSRLAAAALKHELQEVLAYYGRPPSPRAPAPEPGVPAQATAQAVQTPAGWRLSACGWLWHAPNRRHITLTAQERQVVLALLAQQQSDSLPAGPSAEPGHQAQPLGTRQLTMAVCRLRRKFNAVGVTAPIRSIRGRGYMLSAPCAREGEAPALVTQAGGAAG
ncbi:helix-turn-helix domain-containing protein [Verticiella sediminum]|uniref:helix-turn-helix domain-containing protein n=1 Tax=Verticiella sediminum TaxID=1247510 RepID=UPI001478BA79|nr:helix-turn-helix domain-containing protein [Verticiella sediminum]